MVANLGQSQLLSGLGRINVTRATVGAKEKTIAVVTPFYKFEFPSKLSSLFTICLFNVMMFLA